MIGLTAEWARPRSQKRLIRCRWKLDVGFPARNFTRTYSFVRTYGNQHTPNTTPRMNNILARRFLFGEIFLAFGLTFFFFSLLCRNFSVCLFRYFRSDRIFFLMVSSPSSLSSSSLSPSSSILRIVVLICGRM